MPHAGVYVLASLISGVSAALILASGPSHAEPRSPQGTTYNVKRGQSTHNGGRTSSCQVAYLNSVDDFCLWAPAQPTLSTTGNTEHTLVAWCMKSAYGTRLIPDGTITGARLVITPAYVQITGVGNLTNINVPADGVASASGEGDRVHGLVFTRAYGQLEQIYDWTSFVSQERFCFRACKPSAAASTTCPRIHDSLGCSENVPGDYDTGVFEDCIGDATEVPFTLYQEVLAAPLHYSTRPPSGCTARGTTGNAQVRRAIVSTSGSALSALATSLSHSHSHRYSTPLTSSVAPTTTDTALTITFPSFPTSTSTATTFTNSSSPVSPATSTSTLYSNSYTQTRYHSHTHRHSRHRSCTSSASVSSSSSRHSFTHSRSSSTASLASSLGNPPPSSSMSSPASSTPSFTLTFSSSDPPSSATLTPSSTPTPSSSSSFSSSPDGTSASISELSSSQPLSYHSSAPSSTTTPISSLASPFISSSTSSQSSDPPTFTISLSSSSVPSTSPATSSPTSPNSQTQLGSQCPPALQVAVNAGSIIPSQTPLLPLMLTTLMIVVSSFVGVFVL